MRLFPPGEELGNHFPLHILFFLPRGETSGCDKDFVSLSPRYNSRTETELKNKTFSIERVINLFGKKGEADIFWSRAMKLSGHPFSPKGVGRNESPRRISKVLQDGPSTDFF